MDGATAISTGQLLPGSSTSTYNDIYLAVGTHSITAVYSGDATHSGSTSAPVRVTIAGVATTLALASTPNPALAFQQIALTATLGSPPSLRATSNIINFLANGILIGTAQTNPAGAATLITSFPAGSYTLTAAFAGTATLNASSSSPSTEIVNKDASITTMGANPNPGYSPGGAVNLVAAVRPVVPTSAVLYALPGGTYTFYDGSTVIATLPAPALAGAPPASISNFTVGTHILTAVYSGDTNYLPSTSSAVTLNILLSDFTLATEPTLTIHTEHHKDLSLTLVSLGDFTDAVALSCGPMPADAYCTFVNNRAVLSAGGTLPSTVRIDTDAIYNYLSSTNPANHTSSHPRLYSGIAFAMLFPVTLCAAMGRRRNIRFISGISILFVATACTGCSGHYPAHTPPGTYTFTISGQGATTHVTHTATVSLIVTE